MYVKGLINNPQQFNFIKIPTYKNHINHTWFYTSIDIQQYQLMSLGRLILNMSY